jgi:hypothetical protein
MSDAIVLAEGKSKLFLALNHYATALTNLAPEQVPAAFDMTDQLKDLAEEVRQRLRERLLLQVQADGERTTEKGSVAASIGGFKVTAIPMRTGLDPKKLEALLRRKAIPAEKVMDATIAYKVNETKLAVAQAEKLLSPTDVESCRYDRSYRVQVSRE